jgi:hypothetical protein
MTWQALVALLRFLTGLPRPPRDLAALTVAHLEHYRRRRLLTSKDLCVTNQMTEVFLLLRCADTRLRPEVRELVHQRGHHMGRYAGRQGLPGYSDREYGEIVRAARREVAQIRDRIMAGERLLALANTAPGQLCSNDRLKAEWLTEMARTGEVPRFAGGYGNWPHANLPDWARQVWAAGHLFLTDKDLVPLLVLGVALTERNPETVKELPASHRLLEQRAVAVGITKRRRGKALSRDTLHWEIGPESRQLHTPGGFYLLLHMLTRRSRAFSGTSSIWSIWTGRAALHGHAGPFDRSLARNLFLTKWAAAQGITADVPDGTAPQPIILRLDRLKTAAEVRRARAVGGHMPSVATTNTMDVSYQHYLRDDPVIRSWADDILTAALADAETNAHAFHLRVLGTDAAGRFTAGPPQAARELGTTAGKIEEALTGELDTLVSSCLDIEHTPFGDGRCAMSFLTCLRCPNALILDRHLPMLCAVADRLRAELEHLPVETWCRRHGMPWLIITRLILPKFSPARLQAARQSPPPAVSLEILDLLDGPTEPW